ncbi:putative amidohydrolase/ribosomal protein S18 acetylase RimI-like enzyme [Paenibacillus shirakamiensis]|uniref:Amidohydrolase/ribosomal protein S18 acetylase RimI-like enzyme n=1 Tax=Paenibacillus shirakamiensis TaxID=1265935 RepID=A0ABS4JKQ1_9BACL|nr:bifunctional GNAT family N-acetyltransferase/carbon-nitrogen hydrolase family protein [Paenibacillus shirakamiensis]MBP2002298.1 putative amidohydrolase/ribosomal protein S18 acetylase RimI-like enzyme [Paenibacillus shirakamiensis]
MTTDQISQFEKKIIIRNIEREDFDNIIALQNICFPNMSPWKLDQLESHVRTFPDGQMCVELDGEIIGSCSSLIVNFDEYLEQHTYSEITDKGYIRNHNPRGGNLYGMEVMVHPNFRRMKIGRRLYEARKRLAEQLNLKSIIVGGRIPGYHNYSDQLSPRAYAEEVLQQNIYDPVLTFQMMNGFTLKRIISNYLSDDADSENFAALLEWNNIEYKPSINKTLYKMSFPVRICVVQYMMKKIDSFEEFANQCEHYVDVASDYKSDFAVFPENFTMQLLSFLDERSPSLAVRKLTTYTTHYVELFSELAVKYNVNIVGGSHFVENNNRIYNVAHLFRRDGSIEQQYKLHISPNERKWWGINGGNSLGVFDTDCGKISIQLSSDIEYPELSRIVAEEGAQIIFVPFCAEDRQTFLRVKYCAQARAVENQMFIVTAGTVGNLTHVDNIDVQYAQSGIYTPADFSFSRDGIAGECSENTETVIMAEVDMETLERYRKSNDALSFKDRRTDIYSLQIRT